MTIGNYLFEKGLAMFEVDADGKENPIDLGKIMDGMIEEASHIRIEGDFIVLDFVYDYSIHKDRANTPEKILGWIIHLSAKNWMTAPRLAHFAQKAFAEIGTDVHYG